MSIRCNAYEIFAEQSKAFFFALEMRFIPNSRLNSLFKSFFIVHLNGTFLFDCANLLYVQTNWCSFHSGKSKKNGFLFKRGNFSIKGTLFHNRIRKWQWLRLIVQQCHFQWLKTILCYWSCLACSMRSSFVRFFFPLLYFLPSISIHHRRSPQSTIHTRWRHRHHSRPNTVSALPIRIAGALNYNRHIRLPCNTRMHLASRCIWFWLCIECIKARNCYRCARSRVKASQSMRFACIKYQTTVEQIEPALPTKPTSDRLVHSAHTPVSHSTNVCDRTVRATAEWWLAVQSSFLLINID